MGPVSSRGIDLLPKDLEGASPTAGEITVITDCPVARVILIFHVLLAASGTRRRIFSMIRSAWRWAARLSSSCLPVSSRKVSLPSERWNRY